MSTIFCDKDGCMFSDECGFCDCDKLSIVGGVCEGSMHGGRNALDGDIDERLKAENEKLRELIQKAWKWERNGCYECLLEKDCKVLCVYDGDCGMALEIEKELQELGIEVDG